MNWQSAALLADLCSEWCNTGGLQASVLQIWSPSALSSQLLVYGFQQLPVIFQLLSSWLTAPLVAFWLQLPLWGSLPVSTVRSLELFRVGSL